MKCQILLSRKKKEKCFKLSSDQFAHSMVSVKRIPYYNFHVLRYYDILHYYVAQYEIKTNIIPFSWHSSCA